MNGFTGTVSSSRSEQRDVAEPFTLDAPEKDRPERPASSLVDVDVAGLSHAENVRPENEDHYLVVRAERSLQTLLSNLPEGLLAPRADEVAYGMIVAGGMNGMPAGALASRMALQKLVDLVVKTPDWIMRMNRRKAAVVKRRMTDRFRQIDIALREHSERDPRLIGMSATMTVACSLGSDLFLGHIGDSRAYLLRGNELYQLTRDHTLAQAMIEAGVARPEDETVRGMRRVLTAALGSTALMSAPQVQRLYLCHGDTLLLCTDGLTESVAPEAILSILLCAKSSGEACRLLIDAALHAGSNDNASVVAARYHFPQPGPLTSPEELSLARAPAEYPLLSAG
jgi:protein phosphatase